MKRRRELGTIDSGNNNNNNLTNAEKEIRSWMLFADALHDFDRKAFNSMLDFARQYFEVPAATRMGDKSPTETLLMSIMLAQQKLILWLQGEIVKVRKEEESKFHDDEEEKMAQEQ